MKITKKLLIAALMVMGITLMACNNGNGGRPETGAGGGGSGAGGGTGSGTTTLPASKGTDPFEGLELLKNSNEDCQYQVDTKKKTIVQQSKNGDKWIAYAEYNYSYDSTTTLKTITLKLTKIAPYYETLTPIEELQGLEGMEYYLPILSQLRTYTVNISNKTGQQATVTFEGQYNNNSPWYKQRAGMFYGTHDDNSDSYSVRIYGNMIHFDGNMISNSSFPIIEVTDSTIKCISMEDNPTKEFPYTITDSGKETQVTITVDDNTAVICAWKADTLLNPTL